MGITSVLSYVHACTTYIYNSSNVHCAQWGSSLVFPSAIVLFVLFRFTDSNYQSSIFKLFCQSCICWPFFDLRILISPFYIFKLFCLYFIFWPLRCLSFFDLRILMNPLVYSNSSVCHLFLAIVLHVLLRFTDSDYLSGIFKIFCLPFIFWPLCCLSFFDLRNPISPLVSSNSSASTLSFGHCVVCPSLIYGF